jgi:hypothetical protein
MQSRAELLLEVATRLEDARSYAKMTSDPNLEYLIEMAILHSLEALEADWSTDDYSDESGYKAESRVNLARLPANLELGHV